MDNCGISIVHSDFKGSQWVRLESVSYSVGRSSYVFFHCPHAERWDTQREESWTRWGQDNGQRRTKVLKDYWGSQAWLGTCKHVDRFEGTSEEKEEGMNGPNALRTLPWFFCSRIPPKHRWHLNAVEALICTSAWMDNFPHFSVGKLSFGGDPQESEANIRRIRKPKHSILERSHDKVGLNVEQRLTQTQLQNHIHTLEIATLQADW